MAERRMFAKSIIDSDFFLDMPVSTQCLYFHLSLRADDDGFVSNPKRIQKMVGFADDDLRMLIAKQFLIPFDSGIVVIKHWRIHNYIRNDRYKETIHQLEKSQLFLDDGKAYNMAPTPPETIGIPTVDQRETQVRLGKDSIGKESIGESMEPPAAPAPAPPDPKEPVRHKYGANGWVLLTDEQYSKLLKDLGPVELERCITYVDESAAISKNKNGWKDWNLVIRKCHRDRWGLKNQQSAQQQGGNIFMDMANERRGGV